VAACGNKEGQTMKQEKREDKKGKGVFVWIWEHGMVTKGAEHGRGYDESWSKGTVGEKK